MDTVSLFKDAVDSVIADGVTEIVFDLRNNSGGDADAVVKMLDYILDECLIIDIKQADGGSRQIYSDSASVLSKDIKIKILVNSGSASASELFTMSLQDNRNAVIMGEKTYGKSTVLTYFTFKDGSMLGMSTGLYYPQSGRYIEGIGIEPDIILSKDELVLSIEELYEQNILNRG
jgi:carboxyl-terminal processing protease